MIQPDSEYLFEKSGDNIYAHCGTKGKDLLSILLRKSKKFKEDHTYRLNSYHSELCIGPLEKTAGFILFNESEHPGVFFEAPRNHFGISGYYKKYFVTITMLESLKYISLRIFRVPKKLVKVLNDWNKKQEEFIDFFGEMDQFPFVESEEAKKDFDTWTIKEDGDE
jgi:hypothetical protein